MGSNPRIMKLVIWAECAMKSLYVSLHPIGFPNEKIKKSREKDRIYPFPPNFYKLPKAEIQKSKLLPQLSIPILNK